MPFFKTTPSGLRIIIVGVGKVGATLVEQLSAEGHNITVIDKNPQKIRDITSSYDVMGLAGNGASYLTLQEAGVSQTIEKAHKLLIDTGIWDFTKNP